MKQAYLFFGEEDYLISEAVKKLRSKLVDPSFESMNYEKLDGGSEEAIEKIISFVQTPSMLGGSRLLIVLDPIFLKSETKKNIDEEKIKALIECLKNIPKDVSIIFSCESNVDKRKKVYKVLSEIGEINEFKTFAEWEQEKLLSWIVARTKLLGKTIGSHAARLLMEISGRNLRALNSEIEKLITYIGEKELIDEKDVEAVASSGEIEAFALLTALREKNIKKAISSLDNLLKNKEVPVRLLSLLATQYRMLLQVKSLEKEGKNSYQIAQELGANAYFVKKCEENTRNFSIPELLKDYQLLHATDTKLKTGSSPKLTLELLVTDLCGV